MLAPDCPLPFVQIPKTSYMYTHLSYDFYLSRTNVGKILLAQERAVGTAKSTVAKMLA